MSKHVPMSDDCKTIHISLAIGHLEIVRYEENKLNKKSARARAVNDLIDRSLKVCDFYRMEAFSPEKLAIASKLLDEVEKMTNQRFAPKLVDRDERGRFKRNVNNSGPMLTD